jgi:hypothetical protein
MFVAGLIDNLTDLRRAPFMARGTGILGPIAKVIGDTPSIWRFERHLFDNIRFYPGLAVVEETTTKHKWVKPPRFLGGI